LWCKKAYIACAASPAGKASGCQNNPKNGQENQKHPGRKAEWANYLVGLSILNVLARHLRIASILVARVPLEN
tara:strand:- start:554 stop:772 length:219 start_codon:yes stop_codon:yes gene_type:complete